MNKKKQSEIINHWSKDAYRIEKDRYTLQEEINLTGELSHDVLSRWIEMYSAGETRKEIARKYDVMPGTVKYFLQKAGVKLWDSRRKQEDMINFNDLSPLAQEVLLEARERLFCPECHAEFTHKNWLDTHSNLPEDKDHCICHVCRYDSKKKK